MKAGDYDVIISHGPEFDPGFTTVKVRKSRTTQLRAKLKTNSQHSGLGEC